MTKINEVPVVNVVNIGSNITDILGYTFSKDPKKLYNDSTGTISQQLKDKWTVYLDQDYALSRERIKLVI